MGGSEAKINNEGRGSETKKYVGGRGSKNFPITPLRTLFNTIALATRPILRHLYSAGAYHWSLYFPVNIVYLGDDH